MQLIIRAAVLFAFVTIVLRAMGKRELSGMNPFDLVILIVLGDLIQQGVTGDDRSVVGAMQAVTVFVLATLLMSWLSFRFKPARDPLDGVPVVVVRDGHLIEPALKVERITEDEVQEAAREQGITDMAQIAYGVLESGGNFSFLRVDGTRPPGNTGGGSKAV